MDVQQRLDEIVATVDGARSMPMSASCVVNRAELLAMLQEVRAALPGSLAQAQEVLGGREQVVAEAHREAGQILENARAERDSLVSETEVVRQSQRESERILTEAGTEADTIRTQADDYVDSKLANFEVVLSKTIGSVDRGREKLLGGGPGADPYDEGFAADAPERSDDPAELRRRADSYVDTRLGAVAAVLTKTLEAVGRGRQKLVGYDPVEELAVHMAAQDDAGRSTRSSDAEYLAGLALSEPSGTRAQQEPVPGQQPVQPPQPVDLPRQAGPAVGTAVAAQGGPVPGQGGTAYPQPPSQPPEMGGYPTPDGYHVPQQVPTERPMGQQGQQVGYPGDYGQSYQAHQLDGQEAYWGGQAYPDPAYEQPYTTGAYDQHAHPYAQYGAEQYYAAQPYGAPGQPPVQPPPGNEAAALEETSLFDTSMIDLDQMRQYEQRYEGGY